MARPRTFRSEHVLTPDTAKALVEAFAHDTSSTASDSPDSLYSGGSPTFPNNPAFEYDRSYEDDENDGSVEHRHHDTDLFDELRARELEEDDGPDGWDADASPGWGRWPESSRGMSLNYAGWTPSARGSIISISPRGSISNDSRRGSVPKAPRIPFEARRDSNPSLLGFDLANQRRRSSTRSLSSGLGRRRSSMYSLGSGSGFDPVEDSRLRNIASMELLRRRFSEVVEVTYASEEEDEDEGRDDVAVARAGMSTWSPYSDDSCDEDSEIHTAPYAPTPELRSSSIPAVYSNYPLESVAVDHLPVSDDAPSEVSSLTASPTILAHRFATSTTQMIGTPPAQANPTMVLQGRSRPGLNRSSTSYSGRSPTTGVPPGAAPPRPGLARSVSNPWFSSAPPAQEAASLLEKRAAGTFPVARATPLGTSPLRESLRRQSVVSDGGEGSRRSSIALTEKRLSLVIRGSGSISMARKHSTGSDNESLRRASLAERRLSLVKESALRRMSGDTRRSSKSNAIAIVKGNHQQNEPSAGMSSWKSSEAEGSFRRKSSTTLGASFSARSGSGSGSFSGSSSLNDRRLSSKSSRKSSVVSIGEYGYLAPQIVIDAPKITPPSQSASTVPLATEIPTHIPRFRANAPPSIVLPSFKFPPHVSPASPASSSSHTPTPRFNPLESFLGRGTSPGSTSGSGSGSGSGSWGPCEPLTPSTVKGSFSPPSPSSSGNLPSPLSSRGGVMDRGRPVASPEFTSFPFRVVQPPSPKSSPTTLALNQSKEVVAEPEDQASPKAVVSPTHRKPAPKLSEEDLRAEQQAQEGEQYRHERERAASAHRLLATRRGATSATSWVRSPAGLARVRGSEHRRTISVEDMHLVVATERHAMLGDTRIPDHDQRNALGSTSRATAQTQGAAGASGAMRQHPPWAPRRGFTLSPEMDSNGRVRPTFRREMTVPLPPPPPAPVPLAIELPVLTPTASPNMRSGAPSPRSPPSRSISTTSLSGQTLGSPLYQRTPPTSGHQTRPRLPHIPISSPTASQGTRPQMPVNVTSDDLSPGRGLPKALIKRRSITFAEPPSRPKMDRTSSFTRFFQSRSSKNTSSPSSSPKQPHSPLHGHQQQHQSSLGLAAAAAAGSGSGLGSGSGSVKPILASMRGYSDSSAH
ncbi:hypothetical protein I316_04841 [Kwoniella heveanensis BCC8398]|uniref:Uncharacterized protein n=1 Tax=Kwoniella heveanensis BCC8398 TaxID=1296120 RepID=A0A1B9GQW3_9TREE|nr:hypothetical protein I316_04841 [Kwoniella heveanensis BCC8398]